MRANKTPMLYKVGDQSLPADKLPPVGLYKYIFSKDGSGVLSGGYESYINVRNDNGVLIFQTGEDRNNLKDNPIESGASVESLNFVNPTCNRFYYIGNDTIKSENLLIGELVGYEIKDPIKVYLVLGEIKATCGNYYNINEIQTIK